MSVKSENYLEYTTFAASTFKSQLIVTQRAWKFLCEKK